MKLSESSDGARHLLPFSMSMGGKPQRYLLCRIVLLKGVDYRSFNIAPVRVRLYNFNVQKCTMMTLFYISNYSVYLKYNLCAGKDNY